jgi:hypothetical protein
MPNPDMGGTIVNITWTYSHAAKKTVMMVLAAPRRS